MKSKKPSKPPANGFEKIGRNDFLRAGISPAAFAGRRKPEAAGDVLERAFRSPVVKKKVREYAAFPYWQEIVGEQLAEVTKPEKISRGRVLSIRVIDSVWAQELTLMKQQIIEGVHRFGKGAIVEDIKFIVGNPKNFEKASR